MTGDPKSLFTKRCVDIIMLIAYVVTQLLLQPQYAVSPSPVCCASARRERRGDYWREKSLSRAAVKKNVPPLVTTPSTSGGMHPLFDLLREEAAEFDMADPVADVREMRVGDRVPCQVVGNSPLGLNVELVPSGVSGLIYAEEAGFLPDDGTDEPAALGDVVPGYVTTVRDDGKVDMSWRRYGTVPKLEAAATTLLRALLAARESSGEGGEGDRVALGDSSPPEAIRLSLDLSKSSFKAARGKLLKAGLLAHPLLPHETCLAEGVNNWPEDWKAEERADGAEGNEGGAKEAASAGGVLEMAGLPMAAHRRVSGAAALLRLLSVHGDVSSLRGLVRDGEPTGRVRAVFARAADARAAYAELRAFQLASADDDDRLEESPRVRLLDGGDGEESAWDDDDDDDDGEGDDDGEWEMADGGEDGDDWDDFEDDDPHAEWLRPPPKGARAPVDRAAVSRLASRPPARAAVAAGGGGDDTAGAAGRRPGSIFVGNLPFDADEDDLWDLFMDCGYAHGPTSLATPSRALRERAPDRAATLPPCMSAHVLAQPRARLDPALAQPCLDPSLNCARLPSHHTPSLSATLSATQVYQISRPAHRPGWCDQRLRARHLQRGRGRRDGHAAIRHRAPRPAVTGRALARQARGSRPRRRE